MNFAGVPLQHVEGSIKVLVDFANPANWTTKAQKCQKRPGLIVGSGDSMIRQCHTVFSRTIFELQFSAHYIDISKDGANSRVTRQQLEAGVLGAGIFGPEVGIIFLSCNSNDDVLDDVRSVSLDESFENMYYILKKYLELCPNAVIWLANGAPVDESYEINQGLKAIRSEKVSAKYQENIQKLYDSKFRDEPRVQFFDMCRHALQLVGKGNTSHDGLHYSNFTQEKLKDPFWKAVEKHNPFTYRLIEGFDKRLNVYLKPESCCFAGHI